MKNPSLPSLLHCALAAACLAAGSLPRAQAESDGTTATVTLSNPGQPATLRVDMPWADIHIVGVDGDIVTVESTVAQKDAKPSRNDGLRRLDDEVSFELTEKGNVVSLRLAGDNPWAGHDAEFKISVPRAMALDVKTEAGGDLLVKDIAGDIEINNMNGEVTLEGISGSTVVNTMNGEVHAVYAQAPQKLVAITTMNGEVDLRVPAATKANIRLRTHNGSILTDFDESVLKTKSEGKNGSSSYSYSYSYSHEANQAAQAAADAVHQAMQVAREVSREVQREVAQAQKEAAEAMAEAAEQKEAVEAAAGRSAPEAVPAVPATPGKPATPHTPRPPRAARPPMPPITGGKTVSGTLNGGGVDIKISTMNGEITLRQTK